MRTRHTFDLYGHRDKPVRYLVIYRTTPEGREVLCHRVRSAIIDARVAGEALVVAQ